MTISSLSSVYTALPSGQGSAASNSTTTSSSLGDQLLATFAQAQVTSSTSPSSLLQDLVSLSSASSSQSANMSQTYNAQGLLQQLQGNTLLNDTLGNVSDTASPFNASLLQSLMSLSQAPATTQATATTTSATSPSGTAVATNASSATASLQQLIVQDPTMAVTLLQNQMNQNIISLL